MTEKTVMDEETRKEVLFLFEDRLENIRDLKRYQWQSAYYAILAQAGLMAISHISERPSWFYRFMLIVACISTVAAWIGINRAIEHGLARNREAVAKTREHLSGTANSTYPTTIPDRATFYRTLRWTVIGGAVVVALAIASR